MYKLNFFVPAQNKEEVKNALFKIGVGKYENYDKCSFESQGIGQFRPIDGANPFLGKLDTVELVKEYKVEMICSDELIKEAVKVLKDAHPYEEVAYEVFRMEEF
ncbi:MAG: NGG1p interacting factor NIF3 [Sulfurimonas sp.]|uniref:NGG1p interacting factor NIF3 n=1 Tax=Sulfurimonas sp. TaxID=2022749 RepID=UPI0026177AE9|nr:NGG1p interacting factor NIF3 [Sulfurimonas sp.]MCW8896333.1 NGG1p interacting factor NIF3 [Sulfurimonas sp.]MCW8953872.1 NGG1p interacting factor NIF3 [Sulfurimonas sp.]MCW9068131.1 NGG1p interacting factor NIF3 [Sulfurimonas sp.]